MYWDRHLLAALIVAYTVQDVDLDVSTAGSIAQSLRALREGCTDQAIMEVVTLMATKPMKVSPHCGYSVCFVSSQIFCLPDSFCMQDAIASQVLPSMHTLHLSPCATVLGFASTACLKKSFLILSVHFSCVISAQRGWQPSVVSFTAGRQLVPSTQRHYAG